MNAAHLHIILVHFPVILVPLGAVLLALGIWRNNETLRLTAYSFFVSGALLGGAAFLLGEDAEEIVEHLSGVVESTIEQHEEASEVAIWFTVALGVCGAATFIGEWLRSSISNRIQLPLLALAVLTAGSLGYAAQLGGMIRHPEAFEAPTGSAEHTSARDDDD